MFWAWWARCGSIKAKKLSRAFPGLGWFWQKPLKGSRGPKKGFIWGAKRAGNLAWPKGKKAKGETLWVTFWARGPGGTFWAGKTPGGGGKKFPTFHRGKKGALILGPGFYNFPGRKGEKRQNGAMYGAFSPWEFCAPEGPR